MYHFMDVQPTHQSEGAAGEVRQLTQDEIQEYLRQKKASQTTPAQDDKSAEMEDARKRAITEAIRLSKESKGLSEKLEALEAEKIRLAQENEEQAASLKYLDIENRVLSNPSLLREVEAADPNVAHLIRQRNPHLSGGTGDDTKVRMIVEDALEKRINAEKAQRELQEKKEAEGYLLELAMKQGMTEKDESFKKIVSLFSRLQSPSKQDIDMLFSANTSSAGQMPIATSKGSGKATSDNTTRKTSPAYAELERQLGL